MNAHDGASFVSADNRLDPTASISADADIWTETWKPSEVGEGEHWRLRASAGVTNRANSAVPLSPNPVTHASLAELESFYRARGLAPTVQLPQRSEYEALDASLERSGYRTLSPTLVQARTLGATPHTSLTSSTMSATSQLSIMSEPSSEWIRCYLEDEGITTGTEAQHDAHQRQGILTRTPSSYLHVADQDQVVGISRITVVKRVAILSCMSVITQARGRGIATQLMSFVAAEAARLDCVQIALQVSESNEIARRLYASAGFSTVDRYHYRVAAREAG